MPSTWPKRHQVLVQVFILIDDINYLIQIRPKYKCKEYMLKADCLGQGILKPFQTVRNPQKNKIYVLPRPTTP